MTFTNPRKFECQMFVFRFPFYTNACTARFKTTLSALFSKTNVYIAVNVSFSVFWGFVGNVRWLSSKPLTQTGYIESKNFQGKLRRVGGRSEKKNVNEFRAASLASELNQLSCLARNYFNLSLIKFVRRRSV